MLKKASLSRLPGALIGATHITQVRAWTLVVAFLVSISSLPLLDVLGPVGPEIQTTVKKTTRNFLAAWQSGEGLIGKILKANEQALTGFHDFEAAIEDHSLLAKHWRPSLQDALLRIGAGNESAYPGRDHWIFYRPELDYLTARTFAKKPLPPEQAIAEFAADLAGRGIALVLVPTPGKPLIHPEKFTVLGMDSPPQNPDWEPFLVRLRTACTKAFSDRGLIGPPPVVVDPTAALWAGKSSGPQYLRSDSHWSPPAVETVAVLVAAAGPLSRIASDNKSMGPKIKPSSLAAILAQC